jgi:(p)ppGpp synthase/HD superfamily hydrolase
MTWTEAFQSARTMAVAAHGDQRYGEQPYSDHLEEVVAVLHRFGASLENEATAPLLVAAWLHDSVEDTALGHEEVAVTFGPVVADLVWRVTDEPGRNRKERKAATYPKIAADETAILLKLADRIANVESSIRYELRLLEMYRKEQQSFQAALRPHCQSELAERMWAALDELLPLEGNEEQ